MGLITHLLALLPPYTDKIYYNSVLSWNVCIRSTAAVQVTQVYLNHTYPL